jgi:uncharacterized damage-inducible protein DinB
MPLTEDDAKLLAGYTLLDYTQERATTRRVLAAVPAGADAYTPDARSMNALRLAWHIAASEKFFLDGVVAGEFKPGESGIPADIRTVADVVAWYDTAIDASLEKAKGLDGAALASMVDFFGMMTVPRVFLLSLMVKHSIHHRGQLSSYLRPMGGKVPAIYGSSADAS